MSRIHDFTARVCLVIGVLLCGAAVSAADRPTEKTLTTEYLTQAREGTRQMIHDLDHLQSVIVAELHGEKVHDLYQRTDAVLAEAEAFAAALKSGVAREDLYPRFDKLDQQLQALLKSLDALGVDQRALHRAANYLRATDDQLHYLLSAGDTSAARLRQVVERQARALAATADEMVGTANFALAEIKGQSVLLGDIKKFAEVAHRFQQELPAKTDREDLQRAFHTVNQAWDKVVEGMKAVPPQENVFLLRSAVRIDQLHERLFKLLGISGERKGITVRT